ncbi:carbohydrate ABC transporter permease [Chitiniphilus purpureus]|uniref:Carbohydrate ABC transporter permease n=1 Tax=Chitiniphilus purpureus TaxID=2981137 RepID=A0ABY6DRJ2_9NEIS|nr:carbohydrate ABC transporter permease [Chitiniphilus sp. CD1]UXY16995.1 carbohydrate ABC transporter permease [Chitiniphilus sp. CD1]
MMQRWPVVCARYAGMALFAMFTLFPFLWALSVGLSTDPSGIWHFPAAFVPVEPGAYWFKRVFAEMPFLRYVGNSLLLSALTVAGVLALTVPCGYALAQLRFPGRRVLFGAMLLTLTLPSEVAIVPNFVTISRLGLVDSHLGVVLPNLASAFGVFLMKQSFEQLPAEVIDAARVDGAGEWQVLLRVAAPLNLPAIGTLAIFTLVTAWNDYLWPAVVLTTRTRLPISVGVFNDLTGPFAVSTSLVMAAVVMAVVPVIVLFALTQRFFLAPQALPMRG